MSKKRHDDEVNNEVPEEEVKASGGKPEHFFAKNKKADAEVDPDYAQKLAAIIFSAIVILKFKHVGI